MVKNGGYNSLMGEFSGKVINGHRIVIPSSLRKDIGKSFVITKGYDGCLLIVPQSAWEQLVAPMQSRSFLDSNVRDSLRFLVGSAYKSDSDTQGRVVVPESLRDYSSIRYNANKGKEVVFVGLLNWVEVWDKKEWDKKLNSLNSNAEDIAQRLLKSEPTES